MGVVARDGTGVPDSPSLPVTLDWRGALRRLDVRAGILAALLALAAGAVFVGTNPRVYRASTSLVVLPDREASSEPGYYDTLSRGQVVLTFAQILDLRAGDAVPAESDIDVQVEAVPDTSLIDITATAPSAARAVEAADEALRASRPYFAQLPSPYEIYVVRGAVGSAERSGGASLALLLLIPVVALVAGLVTQQVLRALGVTALGPRVVVPLRTLAASGRQQDRGSGSDRKGGAGSAAVPPEEPGRTDAPTHSA